MNHQNYTARHTLIRWGQCTLLGWGLFACVHAQFPNYSQYALPAEQTLTTAGELFRNARWTECLDRLEAAQAADSEVAEEETFAFMRAVAKARRNEGDSEALLRAYVEEYPASLYAADARLELGTLLLLHNRTEEALTELERIEAKALPSDRQHLLYFRRGQALLEMGRYAEARPYYRALELAADPEYNAEASYYVAYLDYQQGHYDEALKRFGELPSDEKYLSSAPYYITQILYRQGRWSEAQRQAERLLASGQNTAEQQCELNRIVGECALQQGDRTEALRSLNAYMEGLSGAGLKPVTSSAYNCGMLNSEAGRTDATLQALTRAAAVGADEDPATGRTYLLLGQTYLLCGQVQNARMSFERASRISTEAEVREAAAYNYAVLVHETHSSPFDEEITVFENFLNQYPNSRYADRAGEYLTEVYLTTRNYDAALASIERIKSPTTAVRAARQRLLYRLGVQEYVNGDLNAAANRFGEAIALGSLHPTALAESYFWRGECAYSQGQYSNAESDFRQFNLLKPEVEASHQATGYYNLGYALFKQGRYSAAVTPWKEYIARPSERGTATYADALVRLGDCQYYTRNFVEAENYYQAAAQCPEATSADYATYQKAFMAGLQKKYTTKLEGMEQLIHNYPQSEYVDDAYLEEGKTYLLLNNNTQAIQAFRKVVTDYPTRPCAPAAGLQLALVYYNDGETDSAIRAYKEVIRLHPASDEAQTALEDLKNIYVEQGQVSSYASYLSTLDGKVPMSAGEQDSLTYVSATRLLARGKTTEAEQALENYLTEFPTGGYAVDAHLSLARAYRSSERTQQALKHYAAVAQMTGNSNVDEALLATAEIYDEQGQTAEALTAYQALVQKSDNAEYKRNGLMGCVRTAAALNHSAEVVEYFTTVEKDATLPATQRQEGTLLRAKALLRLKQTERAASDLQAAASDTRTEFGAEAKYLLAQSYYDAGRKENAEEQVFELIQSATPHQYWMARGFILLADISLDRGDQFQAQQYLQSLQSNYSGNAEINSMIEDRLARCK